MKQIFTLLMALMGFTAMAQMNPENREQKIQALYVAYITQELKLTEAEAQKFWPIHQQYDAEIKAVAGNDELSRQQAALNIKKKFQDRFAKVLGNERTNTFYIKDGEFRKKLVDRLRKMRQQNQGLRRPVGQRSGPED
jgi:Skp family chaperone for outer membrane proteins